MQALDLLSRGEELTSVTKFHLTNIIKVLCSKLEWIEESNEVHEIKDDIKKKTSKMKKHQMIKLLQKNRFVNTIDVVNASMEDLVISQIKVEIHALSSILKHAKYMKCMDTNTQKDAKIKSVKNCI